MQFRKICIWISSNDSASNASDRARPNKTFDWMRSVNAIKKYWQIKSEINWQKADNLMMLRLFIFVLISSTIQLINIQTNANVQVNGQLIRFLLFVSIFMHTHARPRTHIRNRMERSKRTISASPKCLCSHFWPFEYFGIAFGWACSSFDLKRHQLSGIENRKNKIKIGQTCLIMIWVDSRFTLSLRRSMWMSVCLNRDFPSSIHTNPAKF